FFEGRRRHTRFAGDGSSDVCSSVLPVAVEPFMRGGERLRVEPAGMGAPVHLAPDQARGFERTDMLRSCGKRHLEGFSEIADGAVAPGKLADHAPAGRVAEGAEDGIEPG